MKRLGATKRHCWSGQTRWLGEKISKRLWKRSSVNFFFIYAWNVIASIFVWMWVLVITHDAWKGPIFERDSIFQRGIGDPLRSTQSHTFPPMLFLIIPVIDRDLLLCTSTLTKWYRLHQKPNRELTQSTLDGCCVNSHLKIHCLHCQQSICKSY